MNLFNNICTRVYVSTKNELHAFATNEKGVTAIEYAIIAVAMSTLVMAVFQDGELTKAITKAMKTVTDNIGGKAAGGATGG